MSIDKDGLAAAAIQLAALRGVSVADEVDQAMFGADAAKVITAYLAALPNTGDELVARLRAMCVDWDARPMDDGELPRIEPHCRDLREAADAIASLQQANAALISERTSLVATKRDQIDALTARAQAAEASLASAREDALEEAISAAEGCQITVPLTPGAADGASMASTQIADAIRALKEER